MAASSTLTKEESVSLQEHESEWNEIFQGIHQNIDAVAFQDGHIDYHELEDFFSVNKKLATKYNLACWTNAESFDRDMPIKFLPIKFEKLKLKLEAARKAGFHKAITFEFSHFMSPQSSYIQAHHLYNRYLEYIKPYRIKMIRYFNFLLVLLLFSSTIAAQPNIFKELRGTWITNVASDAMLNEQNVKQAVFNCKRNGLTDIFVVVWNNGLTTYPSKVLEKYIGVKQDPRYHTFDPIAAFVKEGHQLGLKVHAWFEFGFSYAYKDSSLNNWLLQYPHWAGRDAKQNLLKKNGFFGGTDYILKSKILCINL